MFKNVKVSKQLAHRYCVTWIDFHKLRPKGHPSQEFHFKYVTIFEDFGNFWENFTQTFLLEQDGFVNVGCRLPKIKNKSAKSFVFCREKAICYCNFRKNLRTFAKKSM